MRTIYILAILVLLAVAVPAAPAHAGGIVSVCDEVHLLAALAGGGTVTFACSGTITLTNTITIEADTTIDGTGQEVTISGNDTVRVLIVSNGARLSLYELTVSHGRAPYESNGGGILNDGGAVHVSNCRITENRAFEGGGIASYGTDSAVTVSNSIFSDNHADMRGGGIHNADGIVTVNGSSFLVNQSGGNGGGINTFGGTVSVDNCTFSSNTCGFSGAGIHGSYYGGTMTVSNSTFSSNIASGSGGGGICNHSVGGTLTVLNCTFSDNSAFWGGGIISGALLTETSNSTFTGNSTHHGGAAIMKVFGEIPGPFIVSNSTFSGNSAVSEGATIANLDSSYPLVLRNTAVANSSMGSNCTGTITDGGGNLSYPDTTCPGINADPVLGPLQDNGGPTWTMALGEGSAAIDAADDAICAAPPVNNLDQRGFPRPWGAHCDIGAVEQIQEPAAVSLSTISAESASGANSPIIALGPLLVALASIGVFRRVRQMRCD